MLVSVEHWLGKGALRSHMQHLNSKISFNCYSTSEIQNYQKYYRNKINVLLYNILKDFQSDFQKVKVNF